MTLTLTGMAVMYPDTNWAITVVNAVGGASVFGIIHRIAGVIFLASVFGHGIVVLQRVLTNKNFKWFGPDSLLPRWKDWEDMKAMFLWFFGKGELPKLDRWTYWEKFDYWAVYWGAFVIGLSGIILWASPTLLKYLPGWAFNVAAIAHGVEAFLAVATLFVVHFFNNHFRPEKFPLYTVMFTGSWDLEEFKEERPLEYERLVASGELEKYLVKPPSRTFNIISHVLGFTLLAIGILLLIMVMIGFSQHGLV
jgi:cytochrome b subunit of formate dehydrogenase